MMKNMKGRTMRRSILSFIALTVSTHALACGEITPNKKISRIVADLAYQDFPKASDILSIIRIESSFNVKAINDNEREHSIGLMQVQSGPTNQRSNIAMGVSLLREYYKLTGSAEGAVKSYNIGPKNYLEGKLKISGQQYYDKYALQKLVYEKYPKGGITYLGKTLGCKKENDISFASKAQKAKFAKEVKVNSLSKKRVKHWK